MDIHKELLQSYTNSTQRREFIKKMGLGLGSIAMMDLMGCTNTGPVYDKNPLSPRPPHYKPKVKSVIYLHMAGAPSQLELFDYKPELHKLDGKLCPPSFIEGKRFAFIQGVPEMLGPLRTFRQYGDSGAYVSDLLPNFRKVVDDVCFLKAMHTDEFNHAPAQLFMHTGHRIQGRPSMGSWVSYGLGSENQNLPGFVVLVSGDSAPSGGQSLWGSGFLPSVYQGIELRSKGDPVLYVNDPEGVPRDIRRRTIDAITNINKKQHEYFGDPEILSRISQYELAYRMQKTVPEAMDIGRESPQTHSLYGTEPGKTSFANNCLLARRMVERGVRFIQLYHRGWDSHGSNQFESLDGGFVERCKEVDQAMTGLIIDLKQRGLLDETLVVWGGEFGRTPMKENRNGVNNAFPGRDHHKEAFTMWMAGGGVKPGISYGETDEFGYSGIKDRIHIHDLQATILHMLGMDHEKLTYHYQGRDFRLTDVHGKVVNDILT